MGDSAPVQGDRLPFRADGPASLEETTLLYHIPSRLPFGGFSERGRNQEVTVAIVELRGSGFREIRGGSYSGRWPHSELPKNKFV